MKIFKKKKKPSVRVVQCAEHNPGIDVYSRLGNLADLSDTEIELYSALREAVPIIDAAIGKIIRLMGTFTVKCSSPRTKRLVEGFLRDVNVSNGNRGINTFISVFFDQLLTYGQAVAEMILTPSGDDIAGLYNADPKAVKLKYGDSPLELLVCSRGIKNEPLPYQELLIPVLINPQPGKIKGTSLLYDLPFVSRVLMRIFEAVGQNWDRAGNVHFAVTYKPDKDSGFTYAKENAEEIARQWSHVMSDPNGSCDFISVGDISIQTVGSDSQVLDCDVPVRRISEQIVAKLGIPPFLLGLSWSTTERMSSQQADILTSELEYYREVLNPLIRRIIRFFLDIHGIDEDFEVCWNDINLQDELERSKARVNNAQALRAEMEIRRDFGVYESEEGIIEEVRYRQINNNENGTE